MSQEQISLGFRDWKRVYPCFAVIAFCVLFPGTVFAQDQNDQTEDQTEDTTQETVPAPMPLPEDGPAYPVSEFIPLFVRQHEGLPSIEDVLETHVRLGLTAEGYVAPRVGMPVVLLRLGDLAERPVVIFYASAVQQVLEAVRDTLVAGELMGVFIAPYPEDISDLGEDLRVEGDDSLRLLMTTGIVTELRTLASGERIKAFERINHPLHEQIRRQSPIQPVEAGEEIEDLALLRKDELDRYIYHLSRHPGRRVDVSIAAALEPGGVALDYLITENRPLVTYFQISNTGTRQTDRVRERIGFIHSQLTNNDDILSFDYITAGFDDDANALVGSYEAPWDDEGRIRWRVFGNWSEFTADQVGFFGQNFTGESWSVGGEVIVNIYQQREMFVDFVAALRYLDVHVDNGGGTLGDEAFVLPSLGLRVDQTTEWFSTRGSLKLEFNITNLDPVEVVKLGRTGTDDDWVVLQGNLSHSFYLEPAFNRKAWEDPTTPKSSTLAHELSADLRWQFAFGKRLVPQAEAVAGGLYTVRGYPESAVAGDDIIIARFEYRYHVPRAFDIDPEPEELFGEPFRSAPQYVYGRPDWDLILKGFFDVARVSLNDRLSFEKNETLLGAGVGVEFIFKRNFNVRLDWGFALEDVTTASVNSGSNRLHVLATILF